MFAGCFPVVSGLWPSLRLSIIDFAEKLQDLALQMSLLEAEIENMQDFSETSQRTASLQANLQHLRSERDVILKKAYDHQQRDGGEW